MPSPKLRVVEDADELDRAAAAEIRATLSAAIADAGAAALVLAGGATPRGAYLRLSREPAGGGIDWSRVELFWGDERCVPPDHPDSNYRMAEETLLSRVPLPGTSVHRIRTELGPERAAAEYEAEIRRTLGDPPAFDLVLLGMGRDGHTASLFPGGPGLESERLVVPTRGPDPPRSRVSLTLRALNGARTVLFLVRGTEKAATLRRVLEADGAGSDALPAARVRPAGRLLWYVDRAAASAL